MPWVERNAAQQVPRNSNAGWDSCWDLKQEDKEARGKGKARGEKWRESGGKGDRLYHGAHPVAGGWAWEAAAAAPWGWDAAYDPSGMAAAMAAQSPTPLPADHWWRAMAGLSAGPMAGQAAWASDWAGAASASGGSVYSPFAAMPSVPALPVARGPAHGAPGCPESVDMGAIAPSMDKRIKEIQKQEELLTKVFEGSLKSLSERNGYGFVVCEEVCSAFGRDAYLPKGAVPDGAKVLDRLRFTVVLSTKGHPQAANVERVPMPS